MAVEVGVTDMSLFAENRSRLCAALKATGSTAVGDFIVLQGGAELSVYSSDTYYVFRQEAFFYWAFGVVEPDFFGAIEVATGITTLFMPKFPESYGVWMGKIQGTDHFKNKYGVDRVFYIDEIVSALQQCEAKRLLLLSGLNTDSNLNAQPAQFEGLTNFSLDRTLLYPVIAECRVFKTDREIAVMRRVCNISMDAHKKIMKEMKPGMKEFQLESTFLHHCYSQGGCRHVGYTCICASGDKSSILHYGHAAEPNSQEIKSGVFCLFDMGAELGRYSADITCTFPSDGKFTEKQKVIYNAVLKANRAVISAAKPGVRWVDMHLLAERIILEELVTAKILVGNVEEMLNVRLGAVFMPHGLGHLLGLDVHDVGGYPDGTQKPTEAGLKCLRTTRILQPRMIITVEPGCYFIDSVLDEALADPTRSKYINADLLAQFRGIGGVRIEDDVLITDSGCDNLSANLPRTVEEIEQFMHK